MTTRLDTFDHAVVQRLIDEGRGGCRLRTTIADRVEATRRLAALGYVDGQIAYRLDTTRRQVLRWRRYGKIPAVLPNDGTCKLIRTDLPNLPSDTTPRRRRRGNARRRPTREVVPA